MRFDYISFMLTKNQKEIVSQSEFFSNYSFMGLSELQIERMLNNIRGQALSIVKNCWCNGTYSKFTNTIAYFDETSNEWYLKPLYNSKIKAYFKIETYNIIIYDLRKE